MKQKLIDAKQISERYSIAVVTLRRLTVAGKLPEPEYLLGKRVWKLKAIDKAFDKLLEAETTINNLGKS